MRNNRPVSEWATISVPNGQGMMRRVGDDEQYQATFEGKVYNPYIAQLKGFAVGTPVRVTFDARNGKVLQLMVMSMISHQMLSFNTYFETIEDVYKAFIIPNTKIAKELYG